MPDACADSQHSADRPADRRLTSGRAGGHADNRTHAPANGPVNGRTGTQARSAFLFAFVGFAAREGGSAMLARAMLTSRLAPPAAH